MSLEENIIDDMKSEIFLLILLVSLLSLKVVPQDIIINEFMSSNTNTIFDYDNESSDWIELYNIDTAIHNLQGYYLSDDENELDKWAFPYINISPDSFLLIWASDKDTIYSNGEIHTNFKIKSSGEEIYLVNPDGTTIISQSPAQALPANISFGHIPENTSEWFFFNEATPGEPNTTIAYSEIADEPVFSHFGGFYNNPFALVLTTNNSQDVIHYSIDGSEPSITSPIYYTPISINQNVPVRARTFRNDALPSKICTNTYFFEDSLHLGVISLVTENSNFWGSTGIYSHYNSGEERPLHIEYFKQNGEPAFNIDVGVKIHAPDSKPQKSFRFYVRNQYGTDEITYKIFKEKEVNKFKRLILRNGGNDGAKLKKTHIRDAFTHRLYQQLNPANAMAAYLPVHVYINIDYWGIYNLRERQDEYFIRENFGYEIDEIDLLEYNYYSGQNHNITIAGDWNDFNSLKEFVINSDMSDDTNYQIIDDWMDINNFIDYQIIEIFIGNQDWLNNNIKFWRPKAVGHKWKWILWDTDYGLGTYSNVPIGHPDFNFFHMAMTWGGWGNEDHTWLLRNLMTNGDFNHQFNSRVLDLLNSILLPTYTINMLDTLAYNISSDIQMQFDRWGSDSLIWETDLEHTRDFLSNRPYYLRKHIAEELQFDTTLYNITVDVNDSNKGMVRINTILIDESTPGISNSPYPWNGMYFKDKTITMKAIAKPGYKFINWLGASTSTNPEITISLNSNTQLIAIFDVYSSNEDLESSGSQSQINIFPVPASDHLMVTLSNHERRKSTLYIYNTSGQCLLTKEVAEDIDITIDVNTTSLKNGMYILKIIDSNGLSKVKKFTIYHF